MRRPTSPTTERTVPVRARCPSPTRGGTSLVGPAVIILVVGVIATAHVAACARLSIIECDLQRLQRIAEDEKAQELALQRRLAALRNAEEIRAHVLQRGLCPPVAVAHVRLTDVPPALYAALPASQRGRDTRGTRLGQLPSDAAGPLFASASDSQ
ncbi:MAG: hypothetical protein AB7Y46_06315 [Armatimonadota bacterium]